MCTTNYGQQQLQHHHHHYAQYSIDTSYEAKKNVIKTEMNFVAFINAYMYFQRDNCFLFTQHPSCMLFRTSPSLLHCLIPLRIRLPKITHTQIHTHADRGKKREQRKTWIKRQIDNSSEKHFMQYLREIKSRNMYKCLTHTHMARIQR